MKPGTAWLRAIIFLLPFTLGASLSFGQSSADSMLSNAEEARLRALARPADDYDFQAVDRRYDSPRGKSEDSGKIKGLFKKTLDSIPTTGGGRKTEDEGYTGISDGSWNSRRIEEIRRYYRESEEVEQKRGGIFSIVPNPLRDEEPPREEERRYYLSEPEPEPEPEAAPQPREIRTSKTLRDSEFMEDPRAVDNPPVEREVSGLLSLPGNMVGGLIPGRKSRKEADVEDFDSAYPNEDEQMIPPTPPGEEGNSDEAYAQQPPQPQSTPQQFRFQGMDQFTPGGASSDGQQASTQVSSPQPPQGSAAPAPAEVGRVRKPSSDEPFGSDPSAYVVLDNVDSDFFEFSGDSRADSQPFPVPAGTILRVEKHGDEWSNVTLPNGRTGIILTKALRRARASELGE